MALLRSAIATGETGRIRREAHASKGASLSVGARGMAHICQKLENLGTARRTEGAPKELIAAGTVNSPLAKSEIEREIKASRLNC